MNIFIPVTNHNIISWAFHLPHKLLIVHHLVSVQLLIKDLKQQKHKYEHILQANMNQQLVSVVVASFNVMLGLSLYVC